MVIKLTRLLLVVHDKFYLENLLFNAANLNVFSWSFHDIKHKIYLLTQYRHVLGWGEALANKFFNNVNIKHINEWMFELIKIKLFCVTCV